MPFSAVVVGVGDGTFEDMKVLDADATILKDPEGKEAVRDIVQLVEYESFKELGMRELALEVLGEVPDQFVDYMVMKESEEEYIKKAMYKGAQRNSSIGSIAGMSERNLMSPHGTIEQPIKNNSNVLY